MKLYISHNFSGRSLNYAEWFMEAVTDYMLKPGAHIFTKLPHRISQNSHTKGI